MRSSAPDDLDGILSLADWNLSSAQARWSRAKLAERSHAKDIDWGSLLEEFAQRTIAAERAGTPAAPLDSYERPGVDVEFDIDGWRLLRDHATIGFGDGGSAKSYLALYTPGRLAQRGVTVLYADWELGGGDHRDRLERLFGPQMPLVHYIRCDRPLIGESDRINREVHRLAVEYIDLRLNRLRDCWAARGRRARDCVYLVPCVRSASARCTWRTSTRARTATRSHLEAVSGTTQRARRGSSSRRRRLRTDSVSPSACLTGSQTSRACSPRSGSSSSSPRTAPLSRG